MAHEAQLELVQETPFRWRSNSTVRCGLPVGSSHPAPWSLTSPRMRPFARWRTPRRFPESSRPPMRCPMFIGAMASPLEGLPQPMWQQAGSYHPGGVGFDISCGVRLLVSQLGDRAIAPRLSALMDSLSRRIPRGMGKGAVWSLGSADELADLMRNGAAYAVAHGSNRMLILLGATAAARCRVPSQTR
jgi:tRNA-splicing ligase RtcB (3'-phosphate/5'-hydroxy nucleic acid ligase)